MAGTVLFALLNCLVFHATPFSGAVVSTDNATEKTEEQDPAGSQNDAYSYDTAGWLLYTVVLEPRPRDLLIPTR